MSFQTELPSLINKWKDAKDFPPNYIVIPVLEVSQNCTDNKILKQKLDQIFKDYKWSVTSLEKEIYTKLGIEKR